MQVAMKMIDPDSQSKAVLCFTKAGATQFQCSTAIRLNTRFFYFLFLPLDIDLRTCRC